MSGKPMPQTPLVLLADDNETDIELTQLSIAQSGRRVQLHVVRDGEQCMAFLKKQGSFHDAPTPRLVLLDLRMPRMSGLEVLAAINAARELRSLPVVVLSTSDSALDINAAYAHRCSGYLVKPFGFKAYAAAIESLMSYWFSLVRLPSSERP